MFTDQTAIVTGGARGLGREIGLALAEGGANVAVIDLLEEQGRKTVGEIEAKGVEARFLRVDVTDRPAVNSMVDDVVKTWGQLDILVNNAGNTTHPAWCYDVTERDWHSVIDTHVHGSFYCLQAAARAMKGRGYGRIVNLSSVAAVHGFATQMNYAAAKFAIVGMTLTAAKELGPHGITVNCLQPGVIRSDMTAILLQQGEDIYRQRTPVRRVGEPADVANAVRFFAAPASGFVTGVALRVDGGIALTASAEDDLTPIAEAYPQLGQVSGEGDGP